MSAALIDAISLNIDQFAAIRRDIHAHPELGFAEKRTSDLIADLLVQWGITIHRGIARTGVVGVITQGNSDRAVGLRADMDALPISEGNRFAHASSYAGAMHACGHDGHTAMLLAAAKYLAKHRNFEGTVYLIFQPAEEGQGGAREMIEAGLFQRFPMGAIFGLHNWPGLRTGQFALSSGPVFAASAEFRILIRGRGTHAAMPHNGVDPIPAACNLVQAFQTIIARNVRPIDAGVLSITMIHAGEVTNVVPDRCELRGSMRAFNSEVMALIETRMRKITQGVCDAFATHHEFEFRNIYPPTVNDPSETEFAREVLVSVVGKENVLPFEPTMAAEDFSYYLQNKPGCYFLIGNGDGTHRNSGHGAGPCVLHSESYDFNDEALQFGASVWVHLAEAWLSRDSSGR